MNPRPAVDPVCGKSGSETLSGTISGRIAAHVSRLQYADLPPAIVDHAKLLMLDTLAVAWAGSDAPGCREVHALFAGDGGAAQATCWAFGGRLPAAEAAFVNGATAAALDYDSFGRDAPVHANIVILPVALAVAQWRRTSGRDFLCALVAGNDLVCRIAASLTPPHRGFAYTSVITVLGAAAVASRLMGLDATTTRHALGLAFQQAGGTQQANLEPALAKRLLSAFPARAGILAARLAAQGVTAPAQIFEGTLGFHALYQAGDPQRVLDGLGERFDSDAVSIKGYPSCSCNHAAIAGMLALVAEHGLVSDDIESIEVVASPYIVRLVGAPYEPGDDPQVSAQFSIRYSVACAMLRGRLGLAEIDPATALDPALRRFAAKVTVRAEPAFTGTRAPVVLRVASRRHGLLERRVDHVPGSDESPLDAATIDAKFDECFARGVRPLDPPRIRLLRERITALEDIDDLSQLFDGLCDERYDS
ncbi:MAG: MmgE/PrpD family protein [bacterium]|nr:MmgE/PrpD family protein [Betaproteobacteria bacterium]